MKLQSEATPNIFSSDHHHTFERCVRMTLVKVKKFLCCFTLETGGFVIGWWVDLCCKRKTSREIISNRFSTIASFFSLLGLTFTMIYLSLSYNEPAINIPMDFDVFVSELKRRRFCLSEIFNSELSRSNNRHFESLLILQRSSFDRQRSPNSRNEETKSFQDDSVHADDGDWTFLGVHSGFCCRTCWSSFCCCHCRFELLLPHLYVLASQQNQGW